MSIAIEIKSEVEGAVSANEARVAAATKRVSETKGIANRLAAAELECAMFMLAVSKEALEVIMVAEDARKEPTFAHLSKALDIYEESMTDANADLVEEVANRLAERRSDCVALSRIVASSLAHLRSFHGKSYTSWDTFMDMRDALKRIA